jgi:hypothetical protein
MAGDDRGTLYQVEGGRQLRRTLKEAGDDLSDLKAAHKEAATIAAEGASSLVPVRTGRLAASIRPAGTKTAGIVRVGTKAVPYAHAIQWGRQIWPSKKASPPAAPRHKFKSFIKPSLFATEGAKDTEPRWVAAYEKALQDAVNKVEGTT